MSVVGFPEKKSPRIWVCACGCSTFSIHSDGSVTCAACDAYHDAVVDGAWFATVSDAEEREDEPFMAIQGNGSVDFTRARLSRMAEGADTAVIVVVKDYGTVST